MSTTLQVRQRGTITIPTDLRRKYDLKDGDTFRLVDLDGIFVLSPMVPMVPELAREIERLRLEEGLTTEDMLASLRQEREQYHSEQNG